MTKEDRAKIEEMFDSPPPFDKVLLEKALKGESVEIKGIGYKLYPDIEVSNKLINPTKGSVE